MSDLYADRKGGFVKLLSTRFYPEDFRPEDVRISEIARGIATEYRFAGHTKNGLYTVAEHSIAVGERMYACTQCPEQTLNALIHDASEGYLRDIPRPIKVLLPSYVALEAQVMSTIKMALKISGDDALVKRIDNEMLWLEAVAFGAFDPAEELTYMTAPDYALADYLDYDPATEHPHYPTGAEEMFMDAFQHYWILAGRNVDDLN